MLQLKSINKSFNVKKRNEIQVLKNVSLSFPNEGLFVIVGPSGSGKTTLLSLLGALDKPDNGSILYNGKDITLFTEKETDQYRQNVVSFIFQENNLVDYLSLKENAVLKSEKNDEEIQKTLEKLQISSLSDKKPSTLSGGEKERCAIARALLADSKIVLCDEPTASLDASNAENVISILKGISDSRLVIVVSHDEELCKKYTKNILHIKDGEIIDPINVLDEERKEFPVQKESTVYKKHIPARTFLHATHNHKQSILLVLLSMIAFLCIAMIVGMSEGIQRLVDKSIRDLNHASPLTISSYYEDFSSIKLVNDEKPEYKDGINIQEQDNNLSSLHKNIITNEFVEMIKKDKDDSTFISLNNDHSYSIIYDNNGTYELFDEQGKDSLSDYLASFFGKQNTIGELVYDEEYFGNKFNWVAGKYPQNNNQAVLVLSHNNTTNDNIAKMLGLKNGDKPEKALGKTIYFADHSALYNLNTTKDVTGLFLKDYETLKAEGRDLRSVNNYLIQYCNDYYEGNVEGQNYAKQQIRSLFKDTEETRNLKAYTKIQNPSLLKDLVDEGTSVDKIEIVGIAEEKETTRFKERQNGILVPSQELEKVRGQYSTSVVASEIDNHIVLPNNPDAFIPTLYGYINNVNETTSSDLDELLLLYLDFFETRKFYCTHNEISSIEIYTENLDVKNTYIERINAYNKDKDDNFKIKQLDLTKKVVKYFDDYFGIFKKILLTISIITLVVSIILSLSITFNIVSRRVKEIGIYRASGYSGRYIFFMLEFESLFLGFLSGVVGVLLAHALIPGFNALASKFNREIDLSHLMILKPGWTFIIIGIAVVVGLLSTLIPSIIYSKKKPIEIIKS